MKRELELNDLMKIDGVIGAVRWKEAVVGRAVAAKPIVVEFLGFESEEAARRSMLAVDAIGAGVKGAAQLSYEYRPDFRQLASPVDSFYVHGYKRSVLATLNKVMVLLDNDVKIDIQALPLQLILVNNANN